MAALESSNDNAEGEDLSRSTIVKRPDQQHDDIADDLDDDPSLLLASGYLQKLSRKQKWLLRFVELRGDHLMFWRSEKQSQRGIDSGNAVSMPQAAIDLRRIKTCTLGLQCIFRTSRSTRIFQEYALHFTSLRGNEFTLRAGSKEDMKDLRKWHRRICSKIAVDDSEKNDDNSNDDDAEIVLTNENTAGEQAEETDDTESCGDNSGSLPQRRRSFFAPLPGETAVEEENDDDDGVAELELPKGPRPGRRDSVFGHCAAGHKLQTFAVDDNEGFGCSICENIFQAEGAVFYGCRICDYDECVGCFLGKKVGSSEE